MAKKANKNKKTKRDKKKQDKAKKRKVKQRQVREEFEAKKKRLAEEDLQNNHHHHHHDGQPCSHDHSQDHSFDSHKAEARKARVHSPYYDYFTARTDFHSDTGGLPSCSLDIAGGFPAIKVYFDKIGHCLGLVVASIAQRIANLEGEELEWSLLPLKEFARSPAFSAEHRSYAAEGLHSIDVEGYEQYRDSEYSLSTVANSLPNFDGLKQIQNEFYRCLDYMETCIAAVAYVEETEQDELASFNKANALSPIHYPRPRAAAAARLKSWGHVEGQAVLDEILTFDDAPSQMLPLNAELAIANENGPEASDTLAKEHFSDKHPLQRLCALKFWAWKDDVGFERANAMIQAYSECSEEQRIAFFRSIDDIPCNEHFSHFFTEVIKNEGSQKVVDQVDMFWEILDLDEAEILGK